MTDSSDVTASNNYIDAELVTRLKSVEEAFDADVIACVHGIAPPFDDIIRQRMDDLQDKRENLLVILETDGGSIETTERIAEVFRHHYSGEVSFAVPNFAMSAGTILVMSGDRILMDYYSILGPIDPQIRNPRGEIVPGLGYIEKYNELIEKSERGQLSNAELAFLLDKFDPAHLHWMEQAREHGVDLLKKWLVENKFKNWTETSSRKLAVTHDMKVQRAKEIADKLNNTTLWRSHARGLSISIVKNELNLHVEDFGADPALADFKAALAGYYRLLKDYMGRRGWSHIVQTREGRFVFGDGRYV